jgi:hypothetical protein
MVMSSLEGKQVVVTGGSRGLGREMFSPWIAPERRSSPSRGATLRSASFGRKPVGVSTRGRGTWPTPRLPLLPRGIIAATELGSAAADAYAKATGVARDKYMERFGVPLTASRFAQGVVKILTAPPADAVAYVVTASKVHATGMSVAPSELGAMT